MFPKPTPRVKAPKRLQRGKRINQKRKDRRRSGRVYCSLYLIAVKELRCLLRGKSTWPCCGSVEADHAGRRPIGRKCSDYETIPLCQRHHRERTDLTGWFKGISAEFMREKCDQWIALTQHSLGYPEKWRTDHGR